MTKLTTAKTLLAAAATTVLAVSLTSVPASAQRMMCTERSALLKQLNGKYPEQRQGLGIAAGNQGAMEFYASEKGTWTILRTSANGTACVMAAGTNWLASLPSGQIAGVDG